MLIVKKSDSYRLFTISDTKTRDDEKITLFAKSCIFIFGVNTPTQKKLDRVKTRGTLGKINAT